MPEVETMLIVDACVFIDVFDPQSRNHPAAVQLLEKLRARNLPVTMPAHGLFEVLCTFQRLSLEKKFVGPFLAGRMDYPIQLIHIDEEFIKKYSMVDIPYTRAGDHIFIVVAKVNDCPLITSDAKMIEISKQCGVQVFEPADYMNELEP
jgi:predicted nucleic acid-binding protein